MIAVGFLEAWLAAVRCDAVREPSLPCCRVQMVLGCEIIQSPRALHLGIFLWAGGYVGLQNGIWICICIFDLRGEGI